MPSEVRGELGSSRWVRKRSDMDIMSSILNEAHEGARKTRIMYRCNLSHRQLQVYLKLLLRMGFLESTSEKEGGELDVFKTTAKGLKFLETYRILTALIT